MFARSRGSDAGSPVFVKLQMDTTRLTKYRPDTQAVQVFYDKAGAVSAISIDFMSGASGIPSSREVLGTDAEAKPDGSMYKLLRYPKAGYWVSYSRTAGDSPTTTITMQKIGN